MSSPPPGGGGPRGRGVAGGRTPPGGAARGSTTGGGNKWVCSVCEAFTFEDYDDLARHEAECRYSSQSTSTSAIRAATARGGGGEVASVGADEHRGQRRPAVTPMDRPSQQQLIRQRTQQQQPPRARGGGGPSSVSFSPGSGGIPTSSLSSSSQQQGTVTGMGMGMVGTGEGGPVFGSLPTMPDERHGHGQQLHPSEAATATTMTTMAMAGGVGTTLPASASSSASMSMSASVVPAAAASSHHPLSEPQVLHRFLTPEETDGLSPAHRTLCHSVLLFSSPDEQHQQAQAQQRRGGRIKEEEEEEEGAGEGQGRQRSPSEAADRGDQSQSSSSSQLGRRTTAPIITPTTPAKRLSPAPPPPSSRRRQRQPQRQQQQHTQVLIGFQCRYCLESPLAQPPGAGARFEKVFPGSVESMGATLELVRHRHFGSFGGGGVGECEMMPDDVRGVFLRRGDGDGDERARGGGGGGGGSTGKQEESAALQAVCEGVCRRVGISNRFPYKTGIVMTFEEEEGGGGGGAAESGSSRITGGMIQGDQRLAEEEAVVRQQPRTSERWERQSSQEEEQPSGTADQYEEQQQQPPPQQKGSGWEPPETTTDVGMEMQQAMMKRPQAQHARHQQQQQQQPPPPPQQQQPYPPAYSPYRGEGGGMPPPPLPPDERYSPYGTPTPMGGGGNTREWASSQSLGAPPSSTRSGAGGGMYGAYPPQAPPQYPPPPHMGGMPGYGSSPPRQRGEPPSAMGGPPQPPPHFDAYSRDTSGGSVPPPPYPDAFVRDPMGGGYTCPHCMRTPYHLRAPGSYSRDPPPLEFVEQHFAICPSVPPPVSYHHRGGYGQPPPHPMGPGGNGNGNGNGGGYFGQPPASFHPPGPGPPPHAYPHMPPGPHQYPSNHGWPSVPSPAPRPMPPQEGAGDIYPSAGAGDPAMMHGGGGGGYPPPPLPPHHMTGAPPPRRGGAHRHHPPQAPTPPGPEGGPQAGGRQREFVPVGVASPPPVGSRGGGSGGVESSRAAAEFLAAEASRVMAEASSPDDAPLVLPDDKVLLTDYFYFLNLQLKLCRFSERDRKTRGGKRENIEIGYGGLECRHCAGESGSRKFFWSDVDRLANSFAEIPGHVMKCRRCPEDVKAALKELKARHPDQMSKLPRGSQKVFFRRMWRRLHPNGVAPSEEGGAGGALSPASHEESGRSSGRLSAGGGSDRSPSRQQDVPTRKSIITVGTPPNVRVLLAIAEDKQWLSDLDCFIRRSLEVFTANEHDAASGPVDTRYPIKVGQVGIRCVHCASSPEGATGPAVMFPFSINGIYETVREFHRLHMNNCPNLPPDARSRLSQLKTAASLSSVLRRYYVIAAKALGMHDTSEGIRASSIGGEEPGTPLDFTPLRVARRTPSEEGGSGGSSGVAATSSVDRSRQRQGVFSPEVEDSRKRQGIPMSEDAQEHSPPEKKAAYDRDR